jgi:hypothetical protein
VVVLALGWAIVLGSAFAWATSGGVAMISVHDRSEGLRFSAPVPMALVDIALTATALPAVHTAGLGQLTVDGVEVDLGELGPMVVALLEELDSVPNATLVEVRDGRTHVKVVKSGKKLLVEVEEPMTSVRLSIPTRAVAHIAERVLG